MKDFYIPKGDGPLIEMGNHRSYVKVYSETTVGGFLLSDVLVDADGGMPHYMHRLEDEMFYILEGRFHFLIGQRTIIAGPGDTLLARRDIRHAWQCVSPEGGRLLTLLRRVPAPTYSSALSLGRKSRQRRRSGRIQHGPLRRNAASGSGLLTTNP